MRIILFNWKQDVITWRFTKFKWNQSLTGDRSRWEAGCGEGYDVVGDSGACASAPDQLLCAGQPSISWKAFVPVPLRHREVSSSFSSLTVSWEATSEIPALLWPLKIDASASCWGWIWKGGVTSQRRAILKMFPTQLSYDRCGEKRRREKWPDSSWKGNEPF